LRKVWKILKWLFISLVILLIIVVTGALIFTNTAPQFGQIPQGSELEKIQASPHYVDGQFINLIETSLGSFSDILGVLPDFLSAEHLEPVDTIPVKYPGNTIKLVDSLCYITWYGHSAFLIEMEGLRILIDPMLTEMPAPIPFGSSRFPNKKPIPIESLKGIDFVILSHDHYDHLDYKTIIALKDEVDHYYTALGVGSHLKHWGIPSSNITELDWWQEASASGIQLVACPARHFSGRGITDRNKTQWASWIIKGTSYNLYFSGDGGYGPHFREIGEEYGPFDLAMLECGQYNEAWSDIHMFPEESIQAGIDVKARLMMPIHWGAFAIAIHTWKDPIQRFWKEGHRKEAPMIQPYIGERFRLGIDFPQDQWWVELD
jgi:L-ascorbate metabolism protein UlaG (beta-lactamase superfamily)